ncbi:hypothetical protein EBU99_12270 [bacterium]|nr:hypothetical protein [bacterium]
MTSEKMAAHASDRPHKGHLFKLHQFLYVVESRAFQIEIQESADGVLTAHAESTSDPHESIRSVVGQDLDSVISSVTQEIDKKVSKW